MTQLRKERHEGQQWKRWRESMKPRLQSLGPIICTEEFIERLTDILSYDEQEEPPFSDNYLLLKEMRENLIKIIEHDLEMELKTYVDIQDNNDIVQKNWEFYKKVRHWISSS